MTGDSEVYLAGLDAQAQRFIRRCLPPIRAFLLHHFPDEFPHLQIQFPLSPNQPWGLFEKLERTVTNVDARFESDRERGRKVWREQYLLPLARELNLLSILETQFLLTCWRDGLFDQRISGQNILVRPHQKILDRVKQILKKDSSSDHKIKSLQPLCRDQTVAHRIVELWNTLPERVLGQARSLILACIGNGPIGLLKHSPHLCAYELIRLERQIEHITTLTKQPSMALATLRTDLIALHRTLHHIDPELWKEHLLHEHPHSSARKRYQAKIRSQQRSAIIQALAKRRMCEVDEAEELFNHFVQGGLYELIDWRCAAPSHTTQATIYEQRIRHAIEEHLGALKPAAQHVIITMVEHLAAAIDEARIPFPLTRLLREQPSSPFRIRFGRRLWFGVPATVRRRQRKKMKQRRRLREAKIQRRANSHIFLKEQVDHLVSSFAARADIDTKTARYYLRNLITYGSIGMLPISEWASAIDERIAEFLHFAKLSRPDGTLNWDLLLSQLQAYAVACGLKNAKISRQIAIVLYNNTPKPRRWHGGTGPSVATVRQRATLVLSSVPQLHKTWALHIAELKLPLKNIQGYQISNTCSAAVIIDSSCDLPGGCWISCNPPQPAELGLALYEAIWHPGAIAGLPEWVMVDELRQVVELNNWPLHGSPEQILLPDTVVKVVTDCSDLQHASQYLMAEIGTFHPRPQSKHPIIEDIEYEAGAYVLELWRSKSVTLEQAQQGLLTWLRTRYFPQHRVVPVPKALRDRGFALPA